MIKNARTVSAALAPIFVHESCIADGNSTENVCEIKLISDSFKFFKYNVSNTETTNSKETFGTESHRILRSTISLSNTVFQPINRRYCCCLIQMGLVGKNYTKSKSITDPAIPTYVGTFSLGKVLEWQTRCRSYPYKQTND